MGGENIVWSESDVSSEEREKFLKQKGCIIWLTGLSGSGKSTIAKKLEKKLFSIGKLSYILDGDNMRSGLCSDLGFSIEDRAENMRRIGETAALFAHAGIIAITAFISPFAREREKARNLVLEGRFFEVFIDTSLEICEERDPKGFYKKARKGEIKNFTGLNSPYESPSDPELIIKTENQGVDSAVESIIELLKNKSMI
jgi:adenylylsulfate kinase